MIRSFKMLTVVLAALVLLCGCKSNYLITLTNNNQLTVRGKPKLVDGFYIIKDSEGRDVRINQMRVRAIEVQ